MTYDAMQVVQHLMLHEMLKTTSSHPTAFHESIEDNHHTLVVYTSFVHQFRPCGTCSWIENPDPGRSTLPHPNFLSTALSTFL